MGAGDPGMEDIYHWDADGPRIAFKGPDGTRRMHLTAHRLRFWSILDAPFQWPCSLLMVIRMLTYQRQLFHAILLLLKHCAKALKQVGDTLMT